MKRTIFTFVLAVVALVAMGQERVVWDKPTTEYGTHYGDGFFQLALDVTKVELRDSETMVHITAMQCPDYPNSWFMFANDTYLKVGNHHYTVLAADGIELDKQTRAKKDGKLDMVFHFPPLPQGIKSFDFIAGDGEGAFQIKGIKPVEERWKEFFPSYWRNERTGDWDIAFLKDFVIYNGQFWNYKEKTDVNKPVDKATFTIWNESGGLDVKVGKDKQGKRIMQIGTKQGKKELYSMITDRFLPDYPTKDTRTDFVDTNYQPDSVTLTGLIVNRPADMKTFEVSSVDFYTNDEVSYHGILDSLGRFTMTFPVVNSTEFFCDWNHCAIRTMLEPGKRYFLLYDFKEGRRYWMGEDVRLQNELYKFPLDWNYVELEKEVGSQEIDLFMISVDSLMKAQDQMIDSLCAVHPTLSTRFMKYRKGNTLVQQASAFCQSRFYMPEGTWTDNIRHYIYNHFWTKMEKPYTLHRDLREFMSDYLNDATRKETRFIPLLKANIQTLDSLNADGLIRDVRLFELAYHRIKRKDVPLSQTVMDSLTIWMNDSACIHRLIDINNAYIAIENGMDDQNNSPFSEEAKEMMEGARILKEMMEPYKGKFILLDIWGAWCGPCMEALSHSQEEYEALKPYDIVFLYLANNTSDEEWKNIIKACNLTGENCVHYNLPKEQQSAIERFLQVEAFPCYKLFDKEGKLYDIDANARNVGVMKNFFDKVDKKE